jgi:hypothetical protein
MRTRLKRNTASSSFAFLGDLPEAERPPLLAIEEYGQPGWRANSVLILDVDFHYERSIENGMDPAHNEFVHPTHGFSGRNRDTYQVNEVEIEEHRQGWGFWWWHMFDAPALPQGNHPTAVEGRMHQYFFEQPVDVNKTRIFFVNIRNFLLEPENDGPIHARNKVIAGQDIAVLKEVYPTRTPVSNTKEVLMPADKPIAAYREWLRKFDDMGWRIDWEEFKRRDSKDTAFAIPSPARRTEGNWVLDPIPLIGAAEKLKVATG